MLNKPEPHARVKARLKREHEKARRVCWLIVYAREQGRCQTCGKAVLSVEDLRVTEFTVGHVHEPRKRSQGADSTDPDQCVLLCRECHAEAHGLTVIRQHDGNTQREPGDLFGE